MSKQHAVIFDLDGTLVDSLGDIANALNRSLQKLGCRAVDIASVQRWIGDGLQTLCRRALAAVGDTRDLQQLLEHTRSTYETHCTETTRCYPNILRTLDLLKSDNIPLAVLSNKPERFVLQVIDGLKLASRFALAYGDIEEAEKKPDPQRALSIASQIGVEPENTFFVGDTIVDIETAKNASMKSVAVTWGFRKKPELEPAQPDFIINEPIELIDILKRQKI